MCACGSAVYTQLLPLLITDAYVLGTRVKTSSVSSGPASNNNTVTAGFSDSLAAITHPAVPPPTKHGIYITRDYIIASN